MYSFKTKKSNQAALLSAAFAITALFVLFNGAVNAQSTYVPKPFKQRTSIYSPETNVYHIQGDYQMIGNTNLTLQSADVSGSGPSSSSNNSGSMKYVDIDGDANTVNSSSAQLKFSTERGANPECTNVIYAGLYWTGRKSTGSSDGMSYTVSGGSSTTNSYSNNKTVANHRLTITRGTETNTITSPNTHSTETSNSSWDWHAASPSNGWVTSHTRTNTETEKNVKTITELQETTIVYTFTPNGGGTPVIYAVKQTQRRTKTVTESRSRTRTERQVYYAGTGYGESTYEDWSAWSGWTTNEGSWSSWGASVTTVTYKLGTSGTPIALSASVNNNTVTLSTPHEFVSHYTVVSFNISTNGNHPSASVRYTADAKILYKNQVKFKHADGTYQTITANTDDIHYPSGSLSNIYTAYAEVTDIVKEYGEGNYFVGDIACATGDGGGTGYFGGWGLVVIYENSKMKWRDITVYDGYAYLDAGHNAQQQIDLSGFKAVQVGHVNMKLGMMAAEGDAGISNDYAQIKNVAGNFVYLAHDGTVGTSNSGSHTNFFKSAINVGGATRNPNFTNNTGVDITMINLENANNSLIQNEQTATSFRFGTDQDLYVPFCFVFGCDAYIPDARVVDAVMESEGATYDPITDLWVTHPGDTVTFTMKVHNYDDEDIRNAEIRVPLPVTINYYSVEAEYADGSTGTYYFDPNEGINGTAVWTLDYVPAGYPDSVWATFKLNCFVTKNCFVLASTSEDCLLRLIVNGTLSGTMVVNNVYFENEFIQGFQQSGTCAGSAITEDLIVVVDREDYIREHCNCSRIPGEYDNSCFTTRYLTYCTEGGVTKIPFSFVSQYYPLGTRFYSSDRNTEYTSYTDFPSSCWGQTLVAVAPSAAGGSCESNLVLTSSTSTEEPAVPVLTHDVYYCVDNTSKSLAELVTRVDSTKSPLPYVVFYSADPRVNSTTPAMLDYYPSTATAGTQHYWARQYWEGNPCYEGALIDVYVHVSEMEHITSSHESPSCQGVAVSFTAEHAGGTYTIPAAIQPYVTVSGTVATISSTAPAGTYEFTYQGPSGLPVVEPCDESSLTRTIKHIITPASVGGTITPSPITICQGSDIPQLTLGDYVGHVEKWEYRKNGGAWTIIPNNTWRITQADVAELTVGTYEFRALVQSGECDAVYSSVATVVVSSNTAPADPTLTSPQFACPGTSYTILPTGDDYQWYAAEVGGTADATLRNVEVQSAWIQRYVSYKNPDTQCESHRVLVEVRPKFAAGAIATDGQVACHVGADPVTIGSKTAAALTADNTSGATIQYQWYVSYNGGTPTAIAGATNATYTPTTTDMNTEGEYVFTRKAKSSDCSEYLTSTGSWTLIVGDPNAKVVSTTGATMICGTGSISLRLQAAGSPLSYSYQWMKDGINIDGATNATYVATAPGVYSVKVTHRKSGCTATSTGTDAIELTKDNTAPVVPANQTTNITGCSLTEVPTAYTTVSEIETGLTVSISDDYTADADLVVAVAEETISTTCPFQVKRTYTITDECANSASFIHTIIVKNTTAPVISVATQNNPNGECNPTSIEIPTFNVVDPCNSTATATVTSSPASGTCTKTQTWKATYTSTCGVAATLVEVTYNWKSDETKPIIANFTVPAATALGNCKYAIPDLSATVLAATTDAGCDHVTFVSQSPAATTEYAQTATAQNITVTVKVADECGNVQTKDVVVVIPAKVDVTIADVTTVCDGNDVTLDATVTPAGTYTYAWSNAATTEDITINTAGTYTITVTGDNGCTATASKTVEYYENPTIIIEGENAILANQELVLTATAGYDNYTWTVNGGTIVSGENTNQITVKWSDGGVKNVTVSVANDHCNATGAMTVTVNAIPTLTLNCPTETSAGSNCFTFPSLEATGYVSDIVVNFTEDPDGCTITLPTLPEGWTAEGNAYSKLVKLPTNTPIADVNNFLKGITFCVPADALKDISITLSAEPTDAKTFFFAENKHYYKFVQFQPGSTMTFLDCYNAAKDMTYLGRHGYLATLTTLNEDKFVTRIAESAAWIGATRLSASGGEGTQYYTTFDTDDETHPESTDNWYWVCGPEKGKILFHGTQAENATDKMAYYTSQLDEDGNVIYSNWGGAEPNGGTGESCLVILHNSDATYTGYQNHTSNFAWNDKSYRSNIYVTRVDVWDPRGYLVEFGDLEIGNSTPDVYATSVQAKERVGNGQDVSTAVLSGTATYCKGATTTTNIHLNFTGNAPFNGTVSGSDGSSYNFSNINSFSHSIAVTPTTTTTYTITLFGDATEVTCGRTVDYQKSGSAVVTIYDAFDAGKINTDGQEICFDGTVQNIGSETAATGGDNIISYKWQLDGTDIAGATAATYTPTVTAPGTYVYTRLAKDATCAAWSASEGTYTLTIHALPTITVADQTICSGETATLTATTGDVTKLTFKQSSTTVQENTTKTYTTGELTSTTTYTITMVDPNGCTASTTATVHVNALPTVVATATPTAICKGQSATLTATGAVTYVWDATSPVSPTTSTTYHVTGTDANGCENTATVTVAVNELPVITNVDKVNPKCHGDANGSITITATGTDSYSIDNGTTWQTSNVFNNLAAGTYTIKVKSVNDCETSYYTTVTLTAPATLAVTISGESAVCAGADATLSTTVTGGTTPYTYQWTPNAETTADITATPATTTSYDVTVKDANNCTAINSKTVTVNALPTITISGSDYVCNDATTTLTASGAGTGGSYLWDNSTSNAVRENLSEGTYTVIGTDANGCKNTASATITKKSPAVTMNEDVSLTICNGNSTTLDAGVATSNGTISYEWSNGAITASITTASLTTNTIYTVTATATIDACEVTDVQTFNVAVYNAFVAGEVSGSQAICAGSTVTAISETPATGGNGTISYQWYVDGTAITGATAESYTPAATYTTVAGTYVFTRTAKDVTCMTDAVAATGSHTLTVYENPTVSITPATGTTISSTELPTALQATVTGGTSTYTYAWTGDVLSANDIANPNILATATVGNHCYEVTVTDAHACKATKNVCYTIEQGLIIADKTASICTGASFNVVPGAGPGEVNPEGTTYTWTVSSASTGITGATANATPATAITGTLTNANTTSGTVVYDVTATNGGGSSTFKLTVTVMPKVDPEFPSLATTNYCYDATESVTLPTTADNNDNLGNAITGTWSTVTSFAKNITAGKTTDSTFTSTFIPATGVCANTATKSFTVYAPVSAGTISEGFTTCTASDTLYRFENEASAFGGGTGFYSWETSTDGGGSYATITGANNSSYSPDYSHLAAGTYTIHRVYNTPCATEATSPAFTFVYRGSVSSGYITSSTHSNPSYFCRGTNDDIQLTATPIIPTAEDGQVNWQVSTDMGATWTNLTSPAYGTAGDYNYTYHLTNLQNEIRIQYNFKFTDCDESKSVKSNNIFVIQVNDLPVVNTISVPTSCPNQTAGYEVSATATSGNTSFTDHLVTPSYTYTWEGAVVNTTPADGSSATVPYLGTNDCGYTYSVTATVTDANGCKGYKSATFKVEDVVKPTIASTVISTQKANVSSCVYTVPDFTAVVKAASTDNCTATDDLTVTQSPAAGTTITTNTNVTMTVKDVCGNEETHVIAVTIPEEVTLSLIDKNDVSCYGASDGFITVGYSKGTAPYSIEWGASPVSRTAAGDYIIENLVAGSYTVTITDADGCTKTTSATIEQADRLMTVSATPTPVTCYGANDGVISYTIEDGAPDYDVILEKGASLIAEVTKTAAGTYTFTGLVPGEYSLTVYDAFGCEKNATATILQSAAMLAVNDVTATPTTCKGVNNGVITYTIAGGTASYNVTLTGPTPATATKTAAGTYTFTDLTPGDYTVAVTDAYNCEKTSATVTVRESAEMLSMTCSTTPAYCSTIADGTIEYTIAGGTGAYTVGLAGATTATATQTTAGNYSFVNLPTGDYIVTVMDAYGCEVTRNALNVNVSSETMKVVANTNSWTYDGASHTDGGYTLTVGATETHTGVSGTDLTLDNGDVVNFTISGSITNVEETPVSNVVEPSFTIKRGTEDVTCHYTVTRTNGTLSITKSLGLTIMNCATLSQTKVYDGTALSSVATPSVTTGTTVEYSTDGGTTWSTTAPSVTNVNATALAVTARAVNSNYETATCDYTLKVNCAPVVVKAASQAFTYDGAAHSNNTFSATGLVGADAIDAVVNGSITYVTESPVVNELTSYSFTFGNADNYCVTTENGSLTMNYGTCVDLVIKADNNTWTYDGASHSQDSYTLTIAGGTPVAVGADGVYNFANGDKLTVVVDGSIQDYSAVGVANNVSSYTIMNGSVDVSDAYCVTTENGVLKINRRAIVITADDNSKMYDGTPLTDNGWMDTPPTNLATTDNVASVTVTGTITNAGSQPNVPSNAVIMRGTENVTNNYTITYVNGLLTITKKNDVVVTIKEHSGEYNFDGTPKTIHGFDIVSIVDPAGIYTNTDFSFAPVADSVVTKTAVGTYDMNVLPTDFTNLNANYDNITFNIIDGQLKIYDSLQLASVELTDVTCNGAADGQAVITITGGKPVDPRYSYTLDGGTATATNSPLTLTGLAAGPHTVVFTDALGYSRTVKFTTVQPEVLTVAVTVPTALCPNQGEYPVSATAAGGNGGYHYVWSEDATNTDANATKVAQTMTNDCGTTYSAKVVVTDAKGCTAEDTKSFTVVDNEAPTFTRPEDITLYKKADCSYDASIAVTGDVTDETDNCSTGIEATYSDLDVTPTDACAGTTVIKRTWTLTDVCGNAAAPQVQYITVVDTTRPTFTRPADITIYKDAACSYDASVTVTGDVTDEADNCTTTLNATYTDADVTPATACEGTVIIERTWTLQDDCGNTAASQVQTITILDNTAPTFTRPADITIYKDATCHYDASVAVTGDVTNEADNCSSGLNATYVDADATPATACTGTTIIKRTWSLVDNCGNAAADQVQTITVLDKTAPTFTAPADITIYKDATCGYDASVAATGDVTDEADNCSTGLEAVYVDVDITPATACEGTKVIKRSWRLADDCGNVAAAQNQIITVLDNLAPDFDLPADVTICRNSTTGEIEAPTSVAGEPFNHSDNCTIVATLVANTTFVDLDTLPAADNANRIIRREWTVTDDCGNATSKIQKITVRPSILTPGNYDFTCPADVHVVLPYNECDMFVNIGLPAFINNMVDMPVIITNNAPAGNIFSEGSHIVTWTATDECGASIHCDQLVAVEFPPCGTPGDSTTDANGNRYSSVRIGCQCWTGENLRPTNYFNDDCSVGSSIAVAKYYDLNDSLESVYGKLYTWYSTVGVTEGQVPAVPATKTTPEGVSYVQGICPCGWAVPTPEQYQTMVNVSGGANYVKSADTRYWLPGREGVDPTALFKARGAGFYNASNGRYEELMGRTEFWTVKLDCYDSYDATTMSIIHYCPEAIFSRKLKDNAYSVRCIRME